MSPVSTRRDFHLHTAYTDAEKGMTVATLVPAAEKLGITHLGLTDHLHTAADLPIHRRLREELRAQPTSLALYFGVEIDINRRYEPWVLDAALKEEMGFQFAIAGLHQMLCEQRDWRRIIPLHHERHLAACAHPAVDVLAHPYWFPCGYFLEGGYAWPMVDSMAMIPKSCIRELAAASRETGTAIEINAGSCLEFFCWPETFKRGYRDYLGELAAEGALFSVGSDAHALGQMPVIHAAWDVVTTLDLPADQLWHPRSAPLNAAG